MSNPTVQNHYGITIVSDEPVTGVYSANDLTWFFEEEGFDPDWGWYCPHCGEELDEMQKASCPSCKEVFDEFDWDFYEPSIELYGGWSEHDKDAKPPVWKPDESSEYAAIFRPNSNIIQVLHSKVVRYGRLASPCYPGQVDARRDDPDARDGVHVQAYFGLPADMWNDLD